MSRFYSAALVLLAIVAVADGAALLRFINTVPTRLDTSAVQNLPVGSNRVINKQAQQDRVGIQYFPANTISTVVQSPTILWTEVMNDRSEEVTKDGLTGAVPETNAPIPAPYAWAQAMPALRQYHLNDPAATEETPAIDRVSAYKTAGQMAAAKDPTNDDNYDQSLLKEDGLGLYLSIAAGTYQMQAYAAIDPNLGTGLASNRQVQPRAFAGSLSTFTFADNSVYTLVATGFGAFGTSTIGNTVSLVLFQESVDPTTFGMASLRWFHGIKTLATKTIDIYTGQTTSTANLRASGIKFGGLTQYFDVAPNTNLQTAITVGGSTSVIAAPNTATKLEVTADVRAGMRATVICAVNNDVTERVFCRMIPSRVVAYVRLVNDLGGQESLEQGLLGPTMLKDNPLSLWASYEFPRPDQAVPMSQNYGLRYMTNHPAMNRGLYPVLTNVVSGGCSGYGEVFVPLMIMDYAMRFTIIRNNAEMGAGIPYNGLYTTPGMTNQNDPTGASPNTQWFWAAATHKRINFNLKTSGYSTIIATNALGNAAFRFYGTGTAGTFKANYFSNPVYLDNYMEPGQYYTIIATSPVALATTTYTPSKFPNTNVVNLFFRLDQTIDMVASGVPSGKAIVNWIPFATQDFQAASGRINFRPKSGNVNLSPTMLATIKYASQASASVQAWNTPVPALFVDPGSYIFDYTPASAATTPCLNKVPGTTTVSVSAGNTTDIFLLNSFGCVLNTNNENLLTVSTCLTQSARTSGNAAGTLLPLTSGLGGGSNAVYFAAASTVSASVLSVLISTLLVLLATL